MMYWVNPTIEDFKAYYYRDFPYGTDPNTSVLDQDITKAFDMVDPHLSQGYYSTQTAFNNSYFSLAAHYLVMNLSASSQGINGQFNWLEQSKGVGAVNQSFAIPQKILDNPILAMFSKTNYGAQYLQSILPRLVGACFIAPGSTRP
jgi:hypothetical protein